jgi:two-component SAPR family response regulator
LKVLIIEDEVLLAMELEREVEANGCEVVGSAADSKGAMSLIASVHPDFAFVDINLLDGPTGIDVGRHLASIGIPYVFVSGNLKRIPDDFAGAIGAIEKPYTMNGIQNAIEYLKAVIAGTAQPKVPPSLVLAN